MTKKHSSHLTMSDVAKKANVSKSTVSQYLNGRYEFMSKKTRDMIQRVIEETGYSPNVVARSLKVKKTSTIGVIVANILHKFSTEIIRAIEDACMEADVHVIVCNADDDPEKERKYIKALMAKQVDGFIVFPTGDNIDMYELLEERNIPLVFLDRIIPDLAVNTVLLDNFKAVDTAVQVFAQAGHTRIAIVTMPATAYVTPRLERIEGFRISMERYGLEMQENHIIDQPLDRIQQEVTGMMSGPAPPTAVLAGNDLVLLEILNECKNSGRHIPEDFSLISIDDVSYANVYQPSLTTIKQPSAEIGEKGAEVLLQKIRGEINDQQIVRMAPTLIARESVKELIEEN
ncbi:LacI family transcriptional regulator [Marinococcus halophilus]|uniref:Ribose operon repressor n=1 Tax=Marinococcus halophilus TaxID=1371 RepID=A0A510Y6S5_MARHA|nr:LacI family DNA-binding transcriptional regulator [Marinococcus halophilus]OZT79713.1 LacI family transcriptional regulator [Marinococcus halophilus]GEK59069.1 ribose operon repressor [Marinococcus halophilus]